MKITPDAVMEFLHAIERGEIKLTPQRSPQDVYAGHVAYVASNGWTVVVFNDCNDWDYVSEVILEDDTHVDPWVYEDGQSLLLAGPSRFDDLDPQWEPIRSYQPRPAHKWSIYRIPGYLSWRCEECDSWILDNEGGFDSERGKLLCTACGGVHPEPTYEPDVGRIVDDAVNDLVQKSIRDARQEIIDDEDKLDAERKS